MCHRDVAEAKKCVPDLISQNQKLQTSYNMCLSWGPAGQFVTLTLVCLYPLMLFYMHTRRRTDAHSCIHSPTRYYWGQIKRDSDTRHHRITLWLPFCELLTHVEAVPSAQRDGEKRGKRDGITQT